MKTYTVKKKLSICEYHSFEVQADSKEEAFKAAENKECSESTRDDDEVQDEEVSSVELTE